LELAISYKFQIVAKTISKENQFSHFSKDFFSHSFCSFLKFAVFLAHFCFILFFRFPFALIKHILHFNLFHLQLKLIFSFCNDFVVLFTYE